MRKTAGASRVSVAGCYGFAGDGDVGGFAGGASDGPAANGLGGQLAQLAILQHIHAPIPPEGSEASPAVEKREQRHEDIDCKEALASIKRIVHGYRDDMPVQNAERTLPRRISRWAKTLAAHENTLPFILLTNPERRARKDKEGLAWTDEGMVKAAEEYAGLGKLVIVAPDVSKVFVLAAVWSWSLWWPFARVFYVLNRAEMRLLLYKYCHWQGGALLNESSFCMCPHRYCLYCL